ncbi:MAG: hypothetical protein SFW09_17460 [Hyphomicrobiaceae bacterium]|nr:hypothetical protein [Hyphomicrobiaceae bacterium]
MTRSTLRRTLGWSYVILLLVLAVSLTAKLAEHIPGLAGSPWEKLAKDIYEYLKDMALVLVTVVATYLAGVYQKRQSFLSALKEEWHDIVKAKSALFVYTQLDQPTRDDYLRAFLAISETLDNMRTVYRNVGETDALIGIYPFAPLHDMRRALQSLDPAKGKAFTAEDRKLARDAILQSFYALRESFLEELDLEAPDRPLLAWGGRRRKKSGAPEDALTTQRAERAATDAATPPDPRIDPFLQALYEKEHLTEKPWRIFANSNTKPHPDAAKPNGKDGPDAPMT